MLLRIPAIIDPIHVEVVYPAPAAVVAVRCDQAEEGEGEGEGEGERRGEGKQAGHDVNTSEKRVRKEVESDAVEHTSEEARARGGAGGKVRGENPRMGSCDPGAANPRINATQAGWQSADD